MILFQLLQYLLDTTNIVDNSIVNSLHDLNDNSVYKLVIWFETAFIILLSIILFKLSKNRKALNVKYLSLLNLKSENEFSYNDIIVDSKNVAIDFGEVMKDINKSKMLYDELIRKYHPDRFVDEKRKGVAQDLAIKITSNRTKYSVLLELKKYAEKHLC